MKEICSAILNAGALEVRDLAAGQKPFLYSSGLWGPGYVMIKGLVSKSVLIKSLCRELAIKVMRITGGPDFVAGNVTGGMIPGWLVSDHLYVPFVYIRDSRKKGGHKEQVTGLRPEISGQGLVVEELVNTAQTTVNSILLLRSMGFEAKFAATILSYENPLAIKSLNENGMELIRLVNLEDLLAAAEAKDLFPKRAINDYRSFLDDPMAWHTRWGLELVKEGGTK